jgi:drug/metabolite transporter (DMT)-like permease
MAMTQSAAFTQGLVVLFALCAAVCAAVGIVVRQRATTDVPAEKGVSTVMFVTLLRRPLWWAGTAAAIAGYVFQALALIKGSLLLVQPLLVSALLFALPLSARLAHRRVTRTEWLWAMLLTAALAVFVVLARPHSGDYVGAIPASTIAAVAAVGFAGAMVLIAVKQPGWRRAVLLAVAVGVLFGVLAVLTKIVMHFLNEGSALDLLKSPTPYVLIVLAVVGTLLQQSAFHAGALQRSVPTMLVLEPVVAVLLGAVVLGEQLDATGYEAVILTLAVASMAAATVALGRDAGAYEESLDTETGRPVTG